MSEPALATAKHPAGNSEPDENISISDHLDLFHSPAWMRVGLIRAGVPARDVKALQERLNMPQGLLLDSLKISPATLNRKVGRKDNLSPEDSERVVGIAKMIGQVEEIVRQSGEIEGFDAAQWLSEWLQQPAPALAGARPLDFLDTVEGQAMVSGLIAQMQSGAYA
jgi:putative toxin-antitoxin system antitoxin component (TIGR02293 family)